MGTLVNVIFCIRILLLIQETCTITQMLPFSCEFLVMPSFYCLYLLTVFHIGAMCPYYQLLYVGVKQISQ